MSASEWPPTTSLMDWMVEWIVGARAVLSEGRAPPLPLPPPPAMLLRGDRRNTTPGARVAGVVVPSIAAGIASNDARPWVWVWVLVGVGIGRAHV